MGEGIIVRRGGGLFTKIKFENYGIKGLTRTLPTELSVARVGLRATTLNNYALFASGVLTSSNARSAVVDAYDTSLTRTIPTTLSVARSDLAATTVGNYALFGGGTIGTKSNVVDAYDTSLTRTLPTVLSVARSLLGATPVGIYGLFSGGQSGGATDDPTVDAYDTSLTRTSPLGSTVVINVGTPVVGVSIGTTLALFTRGFGDTVSGYNTSLTRLNLVQFSINRGSIGATSLGNYALFGGGNASPQSTNIVEAFDTSLTRTTLTPLSIGKSNLAATTVNNNALFAGGILPVNAGNTGSVDVYDISLTRTTTTPLNVATRDLAATTIGNFALFGGGSSNNNSLIPSAVVNAYRENFTPLEIITIGSKYDFGQGEQITTSSFIKINVVNPVNGYIKIKKGVFT